MQSHGLVSNKNLEMSNILDYTDEEGKQIDFAFFFFLIFVQWFFFFSILFDLYGLKELQCTPSINTLRDLSFRVGIGNYFQAEESIDSWIEIFQKHGWPTVAHAFVFPVKQMVSLRDLQLRGVDLTWGSRFSDLD